MIKVVIIEDQKLCSELLQGMINQLFDDLEIVGTATNIKEGVEVINSTKPQIVFMDINLEDEIGFDILNSTNSERFEIIVTTAHGKYAIPAFKNDAIDFLVKPLQLEELKNVVNKAKKNINIKNQLKQKDKLILQDTIATKKISIPTSKGMDFVEMEKIIYIKADSNYSEIHLANELIISCKPISYYEELLDEFYFFRVHKTYVINLQHVKKYYKGRTGVIIMSDETEIEVAESKKIKLLELLKK